MPRKRKGLTMPSKPSVYLVAFCIARATGYGDIIKEVDGVMMQYLVRPKKVR